MDVSEEMVTCFCLNWSLSCLVKQVFDPSILLPVREIRMIFERMEQVVLFYIWRFRLSTFACVAFLVLAYCKTQIQLVIKLN